MAGRLFASAVRSRLRTNIGRMGEHNYQAPGSVRIALRARGALLGRVPARVPTPPPSAHAQHTAPPVSRSPTAVCTRVSLREEQGVRAWRARGARGGGGREKIRRRPLRSALTHPRPPPQTMPFPTNNNARNFLLVFGTCGAFFAAPFLITKHNLEVKGNKCRLPFLTTPDK